MRTRRSLLLVAVLALPLIAATGPIPDPFPLGACVRPPSTVSDQRYCAYVDPGDR